MFTIEQIQEAHSKVKSGADFPNYIRDLKKLGVSFYQTYVNDGHTDYYGETYKTSSPARYKPLAIAGSCNTDLFKSCLSDHQQGKTDYPAFIKLCADTGVENWEVCLDTMTCTYYDSDGNKVLTENIPG